MALYPDVLHDLETACHAFCDGRMPLAQLQEAVWTAAYAIVAYEERTLRRFLQESEARLEAVRWTTDGSMQDTAARLIVLEIEQEIELLLHQRCLMQS